MFKEIEKEALSIINNEPIVKIAHQPSKNIINAMEAHYDIKQSDIQRSYIEDIGYINRLVVLFDSDKNVVSEDIIPIEGKVHHVTLFPNDLLNKNEDNATNLSKAIVSYLSIRISLLRDKYRNLMNKMPENLLNYVFLQSVPVLTCSIMRVIYSGATLPELIYNALLEVNPKYEDVTTVQGINSILNLFDEGLGVHELLNNGLICEIPADDEKYPGIWVTVEEENTVENEENSDDSKSNGHVETCSLYKEMN